MRAGILLAFCFMDIKTAAGYMKHGYRVRRASWDGFDYIYNGYYVGHAFLVPSMKRNPDGTFTDVKKPFRTDWHPEPEDLIADDWELILDGIVDDYGRVKYQDEQ